MNSQLEMKGLDLQNTKSPRIGGAVLSPVINDRANFRKNSPLIFSITSLHTHIKDHARTDH